MCACGGGGGGGGGGREGGMHNNVIYVKCYKENGVKDAMICIRRKNR